MEPKPLYAQSGYDFRRLERGEYQNVHGATRTADCAAWRIASAAIRAISPDPTADPGQSTKKPTTIILSVLMSQDDEHRS